ncbi:hypothetical protein JW916_00105 [Candidatus Sumerlaeota bacterium]|nr:hypothetical protein [Candidatus Sumerlaeota bacterium]
MSILTSAFALSVAAFARPSFAEPPPSVSVAQTAQAVPSAPLVRASAGNDFSFYPTQADAWWKYTVQPDPVMVNESGLSMVFDIVGDLNLSITQSLQRRVGYSGTVTGEMDYDSTRVQFDGVATVECEEQLQSSAESTYITRQTGSYDLSLDAFVSGYGYIDVGLEWEWDVTNIDPPVQWFLDRSDLDELPIGYVYDEQGQNTGDAHWTIAVTIDGAREQVSGDAPVASAERWEILEHVDSMTVLGTLYRNIVKVKRTTMLPDIDIGDAPLATIVADRLRGASSGEVARPRAMNSLDFKEVDIFYWVAEGVGMIRCEGQYEFYGERLTSELRDTNLEQPLNSAEVVDQYVPIVMEPGREYVAWVAMKNTGIQSWSWDDNYRLGECSGCPVWWGFNRVSLDPGETVSPGETARFRFLVTAPSEPGPYTFQWRMVEEWVEWFGPETSAVQITVAEPELGARQWMLFQ